MSDPLVLYYDGPDRKLAIDARAGAELIKERWPGAEVVACTRDTCPGGRRAGESREVYVLGLALDWSSGDGIYIIDPTPDASIALQVWRLLRDYCPECNGSGEVASDRRCSRCGIVGCDSADCPSCAEPPTWLRYLDDAVTETWALTDSREVWAWMENHPSPLPWHGENLPPEAAKIGRAILRARKRWECENCCETCGSNMPSLCDVCITEGPLEDIAPDAAADIARLRTERDGFAKTILRLEGELREMRDERDQFRSAAENGGALAAQLITERDELKAGLAAWIEEWGDSVLGDPLDALCELAEVKGG